MIPPKNSSSTAAGTPKHPKASFSTTSHPITPPLNPDGSLVHPIPERFYSGSGSTNNHEDASVMSEDGSEGGGGGGGRRGRGVAGEIDFQALAMKHAGFAKVLKRNGQVDFSEPESVKQLTLALALTNHALDLTLPDDRLCPPIPNRFNYILFLQRLLTASRPLTASQYLDSVDDQRGSSSYETRDILGVDIGTGASAIYPLLALRQCASWRMVATEIDEESIGYARENVQRNGLGGRCMVVPAQTAVVSDDDENAHGDENDGEKRQWLFPRHAFLHNTSLQDHQRVDFVMTNPPFYTSKDEMLESAKLKKRPPNSACTGAEGEMVYADGGEVGWVKRMIEESALLLRRRRVRVQWWTTTLGKLSSVAKVVEMLREKGCGNYVAVEFVQGTKTKRWAVGWSWEGWRVVMGTDGGGGEDEMSGIRGLERRLWPVSTNTQWAVEVPSQKKANTRQERGAVDVVGALVDEIVEELDDGGDSDDDDHDDNMEAEEPSKRHTSSNKPPGFSWRWSVQDRTGVGVSVQGDCWSRKARRAKEMLLRKRTRLQDGDGDEEMKDGTHGAVERKKASAAAAGGDGSGHDDTEPKFVFRIAVTQGESLSAADVTVSWLFGEDAVLFESFCGMLRRKLREGLS